jgi:Arc/MetJ-type ribon-helix-helix transcriptional regulator
MRNHNRRFAGGPWAARHGGFGPGRGFGGGGKRGESAPDVSTEEVRGWFTGRVPADWFSAAPELTIDRDEILVVGTISEPTVASDAGDVERAAARAGRVNAFREETREVRMRIADEAQAAFGRTVSWGAKIGDETELFTTLRVPVMTRLGQQDRAVLDTLVDAGVARSRSHALAWAVRLVAQHQGDWIQELRDALVAVDKARGAGPAV